MYKRDISPFIAQIRQKYPVLTIIGPRQSGKSTLSRELFSLYKYVSLEVPHEAELAQNDPLGFFGKYPGSIIIDEVQRVPSLLSYIQTRVDEPGHPHQYILTGSQQILLMESVAQSLAGRTTIIKLLPFSFSEIRQKANEFSLDRILYTGGYPRIYDKDLNPTQWLQQYNQTYVERDVRLMTNVSDLEPFRRFMGLCAGRVGQLVNYSSLANDCGISQPTAKAWLSLLQTSFLCFTLQPHFKNFNKRIVKSPKLYFYDTGLLCYLLRIQSEEALINHPLRGSIFENFIITEKIKKEFNQGREPAFYFWRDAKGNEVDLVIDHGTHLYPIEIKSAATFTERFAKGIDYLGDLQGLKDPPETRGEIVYGGVEDFSYKNIRVTSWRSL